MFIQLQCKPFSILLYETFMKLGTFQVNVSVYGEEIKAENCKRDFSSEQKIEKQK